MPRLPALCDECGAVYPAPVRAEWPGADNAFPLPAPCRGCGGSGRVPEESLGRVAGLLDALGAVEVEAEEWRRLRELLVELSEDPPERVELVRRFADRAPAFRRVAGAVPSLEGRALGVYLELVALAAEFVRDLEVSPGGPEAPRASGERGAREENADGEGALESGKDDRVEDEGDRREEEGTEAAEPPSSRLAGFLDRAYGRMAPDREAEELSEAEREARRRLGAAGRNDPCPCGSGEKYKACHWREDLALTRS